MTQLTDTEFEQQFASCTLNPDLLTHEEHIRLAWIHLRKYGLTAAVENLCTQIAKYDKVHGDGTKYHQTLTVAAVYVVDHFVRLSHAETFEEFKAEFPELLTHFRELISRHYSEIRLNDSRAKHQYLEPDIESFDPGQ